MEMLPSALQVHRHPHSSSLVYKYRRAAIVTSAMKLKYTIKDLYMLHNS